MREVLAELIASTAAKDSRFVVLSGDHGYALFDPIRTRHPSQFVNVGVMEQAMVGMAAGLAKAGFRPLVYGLAAFVPIRTLEQIKLDLCYSRLPVILLGDGAGLVYTTLGSSHECGEDVGALRPVPNIRIYAPADASELTACFEEARKADGPSYIRIGKSDRPVLNTESRKNTDSYFTRTGAKSGKRCVVAMGSMTSIATQIAAEHDLPCLSVFRIKPLPASTLELLRGFEQLIVIEEHARHGGLASTLADAFADAQRPLPRLDSLSLKDQFSKHCGSYQYALSEHEMSDRQLQERVRQILKG